MRVIFAGTPAFAAQSLSALIAAGHQVVLVLTQPDRKSGRGMAVVPSAVKQVALAHRIEVFQPESLRNDEALARIRSAQADVMVVAAYGLIVPPAILDAPRFGGINIHASLLPRWRGAAPIQRALLAGDAQTGVCIMQMEAGLDTGPVLLADGMPILAEDTAGTLHDRLAALGARLIVDALGRLPLAAQPQPADGVTYAAKIEKEEAKIDWRRSAQEIDRLVRAFNPFPGALATLDGQALKVWQACPVDAAGEPGRVLAADRDGLVVACGERALRLLEVQKAGGKRLSIAQFLAGQPAIREARFDLP